MKNPFFSIIIPTFNSERFIERTIRSVLKQDYSNYELIIVDDGSVDSTATILKKYSHKDERIKIITTPNSGGPTVPTNIGLNIAQGLYVTFLDHDDEWKPHKLSYLHTYCKEHPDIGFIASNVEHIDDKTKKITPAKITLTKGNVSKKNMLAGNYFNTFSMLCIKKSVLDSVGYLDTNLKVFADFDIVTRMIAHNIPYTFLPDILVTYHLHDSNTSDIVTAAPQRAKDLKKIVTKYEKTFKKHPGSYAQVLQAIASLHLYMNEKDLAIEYFKQVIKVYPYNPIHYVRLAAAYLGSTPYTVARSVKRKISS